MTPARLAELRCQLAAVLANDEDFRADWEQAVQQVTDSTVAQILHQHDQGQDYGRMQFDICVPVPDGWDAHEVSGVFSETVRTQGNARLAAMRVRGLL